MIRLKPFSGCGDRMNILAVVGLGLVAAVLAIILKQYKPEFGLYISLLAGILILVAALSAIRPVLDTVSELTEAGGVGGLYGEVLLKALAVCYISQLATDTCKDAGETAIAGKLEMAGKIAILVISLPLFKSLVDMIVQLMG